MSRLGFFVAKKNRISPAFSRRSHHKLPKSKGNKQPHLPKVVSRAKLVFRKGTGLCYAPPAYEEVAFSPENYLKAQETILDQGIDAKLFKTLSPDNQLLLIQYCDKRRIELKRLKETESKEYQQLTDIKSAVVSLLPICRDWKKHKAFSTVLKAYSNSNQAHRNLKRQQTSITSLIFQQVESHLEHQFNVIVSKGFNYTVKLSDIKDDDSTVEQVEKYLALYKETEQHLSHCNDPAINDSDSKTALENIKVSVRLKLNTLEHDLVGSLSHSYHLKPQTSNSRVFILPGNFHKEKYDEFMNQYNQLIALGELVKLDFGKNREQKIKVLNAIEHMKTHLLKALLNYIKYELDLFHEEHKFLMDHVTRKRLGVSIGIALMVNGLMKLAGDVNALVDFVIGATVAHSLLIVLGAVLLGLCVGSLLIKEILPYCKNSIRHFNTMCMEGGKQDILMRAAAKSIRTYLQNQSAQAGNQGIQDRKKHSIAKAISVLSTIREKDIQPKIAFYKTQKHHYKLYRRLRMIFSTMARYIISLTCGFVATLGTDLIGFSFANGVAKVSFVTLASVGFTTPMGIGLLVAFFILVLVASAIANKFLKPYINASPWFTMKGEKMMREVVNREAKHPFDHSLPYVKGFNPSFYAKKPAEKAPQASFQARRKSSRRSTLRKMKLTLCGASSTTVIA